MNKRSFLKQISALGMTAVPFITYLEHLLEAHDHLTPHELAADNVFWDKIRRAYRLKPDYINLENGYYCFMPEEVLDKYIQQVKRINYEASYYLRTEQFQNKNRIASRLAAVAGCSPDELIITRNTTESLDTIIGGIHWQKGDEAIMANQDYYAMLAMFDQVAKRYDIKTKRIDVPLHPVSDEEIVALYEGAITKKTRLIMVCHMVNLTGQILPVKKICAMAHRHGVQVMVDGAHAFAHIDFNMHDLGCDYYGASLHKWLSAPLGAGILYVKSPLTAGIWPRFAEPGKEDDDILRLNHTGTHPVHTDLAINHALDFHLKIGIKRKEARLRYLQNYWTSKLRDLTGVNLNTPVDPERSCAIANIGVEGLDPKELSKILLEKYKIWTVAINNAGVVGCRIAPNIYTTTAELDIFISAMQEILNS